MIPRDLRPLGWLAAAAAGLLLFALIAGALGFRFDPFDQVRRRADRAEAAAARARDEADSRRLQAEGERGQARRLETVRRQAAAASATLDDLEPEARRTPDATHPLDSDRADRLRAHDRELCRLAPGLGGCAAETDVAGGGD